MSAESGVEMIAAERRRQVEVEGWTPGHDDEHDLGGLALAAASYALPAGDRAFRWYVLAKDSTDQPVFVERSDWARPAVACFDWESRTPRTWPWGEASWKPSPDDRVRELVKAGALIAAEIDRIRRVDSSGAPS